MGTGKFLGQAVDVVEIAVGLVLVLLLQFRTVETFVVEFWTIVLLGYWLTNGLGMLLLVED